MKNIFNMIHNSNFIFKLFSEDFRQYWLHKTGHSLYKTGIMSGKVLEFIGTSGVGKTTIYRECVSGLRKRWFFAYQLDSVTRTLPPSEADQILMRALKRRIEKIYKSDSFCPWHSLLDLKLSMRVMHDTMLVEGSEHPLGFVFDEGLFRHFAAEILELGDEFPAHLWKNRAFVYVRARQPETVLSRYISRSTMSREKQMLRIRTDSEHLLHVKQDQELFQSVVERAVSLGCPLLAIDAENPIQDSVSKVLDFERSLSHKLRGQ